MGGVNNYYVMMRYMLQKKSILYIALVLGISFTIFAITCVNRSSCWSAIVRWGTDHKTSRPLGLDVFVSSIPAERIKSLEIEDLPSTPDSRSLQSFVSYKDHVFVSSDHHILEYS